MAGSEVVWGERKVNILLHSNNKCAYPLLSDLFSALSVLGGAHHTTENQLLWSDCHSPLETTLTNSHRWCLTTTWASLSPVMFTYKIDHHTLRYIFKNPDNYSTMRICFNPYANYGECFIATEKQVEINKNTFLCENFTVFPSSSG